MQRKELSNSQQFFLQAALQFGLYDEISVSDLRFSGQGLWRLFTACGKWRRAVASYQHLEGTCYYILQEKKKKKKQRGAAGTTESLKSRHQNKQSRKTTHYFSVIQ
jgi:hypothetical protein